jgi:uncharacterized protein (TIGR02284 family)
MAMTNNEVISVLNNLIETCRDGHDGFRSAADGVTDPALKGLFEQYSHQRAQFVDELQDEVLRLGGNPQQRGSVAAALHRGWINIKSAVTGKDEQNILAEAERGEDSAIRNYEDALNSNLPPDVVSLVLRQYNIIRQAHDRVRSLRDRTRTARA